jgi:uncharacterized HhH-GPD family protein
MVEALHWTEDEDANKLLARNPLALLIGMLLDQQFPMERAFIGPHLLSRRLGRELDAADIAAIDEDELIAHFKGPPAIHRYPASMAKRTQALCRAIVEDYGGDAAEVWITADDAGALLTRLRALPGYGNEKSRIFIGILGKRLDAAPRGWEEKAADWPSIADVAVFDDVFVLREQKRAMKEAKKRK